MQRRLIVFSVGRGEPCVRPSFLQTGNIADRWPGIQRNVSCQANPVFALGKNRCMLNVYTLHVKNKKIVECSNIKFIKEANPYSNRKYARTCPMDLPVSPKRATTLFSFNVQLSTCNGALIGWGERFAPINIGTIKTIVMPLQISLSL